MILFGDKIMTPRLCLRKVEQEDLPYIVAWSSSREAYGEYLTPEQQCTEKYLAELKSGSLWSEQSKTFVVEVKDEGMPIGTIHYWLRPEKSSRAVIALKVAIPSYRCKGYGTEAQKYLIIHLFQKMQLEGIEMYTDIGNAAQQRCLQKLGFDLAESLQYEDAQIKRTGHLFRLDAKQYMQTSIYHYFYE
jgi:RimJ/RimL family protein N-acetyltransferase